MISHTDLETFGLALIIGAARSFGTFAFLPFLSRQNTTALIRVSLSVALVLPVIPVIAAALPPGHLEMGSLFAVLAREFTLGILLGFGIAVPFWAAEAIGFVISNQSGATIASVINPTSGNDSSDLAVLIYQAYVVLFLASGGLERLVDLLCQSYAAFPASTSLLSFAPDFPRHFLGLLDQLLRTGIGIAAPAMIVMLLAEFGLGIVSLFAPQMQVFFLAMPVKAAAALFVLVLYFPTMMEYLYPSITALPELLKALARMVK